MSRPEDLFPSCLRSPAEKNFDEIFTEVVKALKAEGQINQLTPLAFPYRDAQFGTLYGVMLDRVPGQPSTRFAFVERLSFFLSENSYPLGVQPELSLSQGVELGG